MDKQFFGSFIIDQCAGCKSNVSIAYPSDSMAYSSISIAHLTVSIASFSLSYQ